MEAGLQVEDDFAVLNGDDTACGETTSITSAVNFIQDGRSGVTGAQEVSVQ
jgi:hypothetical protein